jgi:hypothetical protein
MNEGQRRSLWRTISLSFSDAIVKYVYSSPKGRNAVLKFFGASLLVMQKFAAPISRGDQQGLAADH